MIKTILVPVDVAAEEPAGAALGLARDLADKYGGRLVLLNVVEEVPGYVISQLPTGFHQKALDEAGALLKGIAAKNGLADSADTVIREGHPSTQILEYAEEISADMIVIASHDPGLADYFLGSVAARVVRHAHCSVLVARKLAG
ncbi:MAG: universal stress protein [Kiloniellales bacterium]|nr:universal stress protein [Kiloniellales bacterium]